VGANEGWLSHFNNVLSLFVAMVVCGASIATESVARADVLAADAKACAALENKQFGPGRIVAATFVRPPFYTRWMNSSRSATVHIPFCRLEGQADPVPGSHIGFEVWLPARTIWNVRLLGIGAGGSMGAVNTLDMADGANRGFAVVATDNGHRSGGTRDGIEWAYGHAERIVDFAYRAHHLSTMAAKALVSSFYGRKAQYAFNFGCSRGGHTGIMMAQRFPEDYDGIVAGAPVYSWVNEMTFQAWTVRALTETPRSALSVSVHGFRRSRLDIAAVEF
jgi:S-formylglutathione hydrolase FrmB